MCLHGVGSAIHPDDLLGQLTSRQWAEWQIYTRIYLTPMQRADVNAAMIRQNCGQWKKVPKLKDLLILYGGKRKKSAAEMKSILMAWAAQAAQSPANKRGK